MNDLPAFTHHLNPQKKKEKEIHSYNEKIILVQNAKIQISLRIYVVSFGLMKSWLSRPTTA